jgi:hypothetical protein
MKKILLALTFVIAFAGIASADGFLLPLISASPASVDFGNVPLYAVATANIVVSNDGDFPLVATRVSTAAPFLDGTDGFTIYGHSSRRVQVAFAPTQAGTASGNLLILSNADNYPVFLVPLTGYGY